MRKFVPYSIIYTSIFYLKKIEHEKAIFWPVQIQIRLKTFG
jgi:hypothetical protein